MIGSKAKCRGGDAACGALAGIAGTLVITITVRMFSWFESAKAARQKPSKLPQHPFEKEEVREWQDRSRSPSAYSKPAGEQASGAPPAVTPAGALSEVTAPGPEGTAELFFVKAGSGLFDRDVSPYSRIGGKVLHVAYGTLGGAIYGCLPHRKLHAPWIHGSLFGLVLWGVGPGWIVPAMHLIPPLRRTPKREVALMIAGHLIYGVSVAAAFNRFVRGKR